LLLELQTLTKLPVLQTNIAGQVLPLVSRYQQVTLLNKHQQYPIFVQKVSTHPEQVIVQDA